MPDGIFSGTRRALRNRRLTAGLSRTLYVLMAVCVLCAPGCSKTSLPDGRVPPAGSRVDAMFTPLRDAGAVRLTPSEAADLAARLSPAGQRLNSWNDLAFPVSQSLAYAASRPARGQALAVPGLQVTYGQLAATLRHLQTLLPRLDSRPELLATEFTWYRIGPDFGLTGYFEPTLQASRTRSPAYPYPLYRRPPDLKKGVPYHTRHAIDRKGVLAGRGLEIAWVTSETDAFFLHIQGSGRLRFEDGSVTHVLYADKNNRAYTSLGRVMRDEGLIAPDAVSMQSIRQVLERFPERRAELFDRNASYIFFREAEKGPLGAMGRPLTPWVSTATDRTVLPHGSLVFLAVPLPGEDGTPAVPFYGLTLPQDAGGAIKKNRMDLFCGPGDQAAHTAGYLDARGAVYVLVRQ